MKHKPSSKRWLAEHFKDEYVKKAQELGFRSRAVFKLQEIQHRDHLFKAGMTVLDLGSAPGGWSQYAVKQIKNQGRVIALDILPMDKIPGVMFIQGDFQARSVLEKLNLTLAGSKVDLVMSDMSPNMSGNRFVDHCRAMNLAELALNTAANVLARHGVFLVKVFHGEGFDDFLEDTRQRFEKVEIRKPKASRARSREVYILARGFKF